MLEGVTHLQKWIYTCTNISKPSKLETMIQLYSNSWKFFYGHFESLVSRQFNCMKSCLVLKTHELATYEDSLSLFIGKLQCNIGWAGSIQGGQEPSGWSTCKSKFAFSGPLEPHYLVLPFCKKCNYLTFALFSFPTLNIYN